MAVTIVWTDEAAYDLQNIFDYYNMEAGLQVAEKMVINIIEATFQLTSQPNIGQKEPLLKERIFDYRYLVKGNYKIIYWTDDTILYIASVFDCRQNPEKMQSI